MRLKGHKDYNGVVEDTRIGVLRQDLYSIFEGKTFDDPKNPVGVQVYLMNKKREFGVVTDYDGISLGINVIGIASGLTNNTLFYLDDIEKVTPLDEITTKNLKQLADKNAGKTAEIKFRAMPKQEDLGSKVV